RRQITSIVVTGSSTEFRVYWNASPNRRLVGKPFVVVGRTASTAHNPTELETFYQQARFSVPLLLSQRLDFNAQFFSRCCAQSIWAPRWAPDHVYDRVGNAWHLLKAVSDLLTDFHV